MTTPKTGVIAVLSGNGTGNLSTAQRQPPTGSMQYVMSIPLTVGAPASVLFEDTAGTKIWVLKNLSRIERLRKKNCSTGKHKGREVPAGAALAPATFRLGSDQVLAILRLRQCAVERTALKCGRSTRLTNAGWRERRETDADARNVRVIDFEKALATLDAAHQYALVLTYRDRVGNAATAAAIGCSIRTLAYMLPDARRRLADALTAATFCDLLPSWRSLGHERKS